MMEHNTTTDLKKRIMRRVYAVWFLRSVAPLLGAEIVLLVGVAAGVLTHISVRHILLNALAASEGGRSFVQFFIDNFLVKSIQSRLLLALYLVLAAFFIRDLSSVLGRLRQAGRGGLAATLVGSRFS